VWAPSLKFAVLTLMRHEPAVMALPKSLPSTLNCNETRPSESALAPNVTVRSDALTIAASFSRKAMCAAPIASGDVPKAFNIKGVPVKVLFAPEHTPELEIMKQMLKATDRVDFAIFTFAGSSGIDDVMLMLAAAKRRVTGAVDPGQGVQEWAATHELNRAGIALYYPDRTAPFRKLHHKLMVIDEAIVVAGSFNYTAPANQYNDENIFVIGSPYPDLPEREGGPVDPKACAEIARYFRTEIERIVDGGTRFA